MATPYIIQGGDVIYGYNLGDGNQGPYEHGGAIYIVVLVNDAPSQLPIRTGVFKSTNGGVSFTEMDSANAPLSPPSEWAVSCFYPQTGGNVLYILSQQGSDVAQNPLGIFSFDMSTDTWTTIATSGPNAADEKPNQLLVRTSTGEFVAFYTQVSGSIFSTYGVTCSSIGVWGTPHLLGTGGSGTPSTISLAGIDNADTAVVVWISNSDAQFYVNTWTSGGGFSAKSIAFPFATPWNPNRYDLGQGWNAQGKFIVAENKIGWCLALFPTPGDIQPTMLIADMSTIPPVFSLATIVLDTTESEDTFWTDFCISPDASTLTAMWTVQGSGPGNTPNQVMQSTSSLLAGTWSTPIVYWDNAVDPPVTPPTQGGGADRANIPNSVCVRQLSIGVRVMIGLYPIQDAQDVYQGQYFLSIPATATLELTKIVVGGNANASDFFVQATGNNNTISGNGHVGPSNVNPDTYLLSDTAFSDLIWSNNNQLWSNANNSWTQNYVSGNWNCGNATMPTPNSVVVPANGTVACTITNTFSSPPPPPPPAPSQTGTCRTILHLWQLAAAPQVEITTDRASDWNNGGHEGNKFYQGLKLDADTFGQPKTMMIRDADTNTLHVLQPGVVNHSGRRVVPYSFQTPFSAHMVKDEPQDLVPWRKFGITYVYELTPESVQTWITQFTAHGLKGYQHIARIEAAYSSTSAVVLTITSYDGMSPVPITLPSTGGVYQKLLLTLTANKGQLYRYAAQSNAPFQLYLDDWIVWLGQWGRSEAYMPYRNLGGSFGDKATI